MIDSSIILITDGDYITW